MRHAAAWSQGNGEEQLLHTTLVFVLIDQNLNPNAIQVWLHCDLTCHCRSANSN